MTPALNGLRAAIFRATFLPTEASGSGACTASPSPLLHFLAVKCQRAGKAKPPCKASLRMAEDIILDGNPHVLA